MLKKCSIMAFFTCFLGWIALQAQENIDLVTYVQSSGFPSKQEIVSLALSRIGLIAISFSLGFFTHFTPWINLLGVGVLSPIFIVGLVQRLLYSGIIIFATVSSGIAIYILSKFFDLPKWTKALYPHYPTIFVLLTFGFFIMAVRLFLRDLSHEETKENSIDKLNTIHLFSISFVLSFSLFFVLSLLLGSTAVRIFSSSFSHTLPIYLAFSLGITLPILSQIVLEGIECTGFWKLFVHWGQTVAAWLVLGMAFLSFRCLCDMVTSCLTIYAFCLACYAIAFVMFLSKEFHLKTVWVVFCLFAVAAFLTIKKTDLVLYRSIIQAEAPMSLPVIISQ